MSAQAGAEPPGNGSDRSASARSALFTGKTAWARNLAAPVRDFLSAETGGAVVMLGAVVAALLWANSPWPDSYESFWTTNLSVSLGSESISLDLREWVNQGLMTFFFLVLGLEAKREFDTGELRERRRLGIPVAAALGGMTVPIAIYLAFNAGGEGAHGWGAAMSTDTALALGVLALVAPGGTRLRLRLLTVAVVDDLVALVVIATVPIALGLALLSGNFGRMFFAAFPAVIAYALIAVEHVACRLPDIREPARARHGPHRRRHRHRPRARGRRGRRHRRHRRPVHHRHAGR